MKFCRLFVVTVLFLPLVPALAGVDPAVVDRLRGAVASIEFGESYGTAFLGGAPDLVLTAAHVVPEGTDKTILTFSDGEEVEAQFLSYCRLGHDLAALRLLAPTTRPFLPLAGEGALRDGQTIFSVGTPFRLHPALLGDGIVGHHRPDYGLFLHTAPISSGSSGGPIVDAAGAVVGVISSEYLDGSDYSTYGSGFNASIDLASLRRFLQQLAAGVIEERRFPFVDFLSLPLDRVEVNTSVRGVLAPESDRLPENLEFGKGYLIELEAGSVYRLRMESEDFDAYLMIIDQDSELSAENDDVDESTTDAGLFYTAKQSGYHVAVATSLAQGETGAFTFHFEAVRFGDPEVTSGTLTESDSLSDLGLLFRDVPLRGDGNVVAVELRSEDFDAVLEVLDEAGMQVAWNDDREDGTTDARVVFSSREGSDYRVRISTFEPGEQGAFTLLVSRTIEDR